MFFLFALLNKIGNWNWGQIEIGVRSGIKTFDFLKSHDFRPDLTNLIDTKHANFDIFDLFLQKFLTEYMYSV